MHKSTKIQTVESLLSRTVSVEGCLEWTGSTRGGYGRVTTQGKGWTVIRLIWTLQHGEIPEGNVVRHTCDNPKCCNPEHLVVGTQGDNMQDRFNRGRYSLFPLPSMVKALISRGLTQASIAGFFSGNQGHVSRIHRGEYRGAKCY